MAAGGRGAQQGSLVLGVGVAPNNLINSPSSSANNGWAFRQLPITQVSAAFNGSIPVDMVAPMVGFWDYPLTCVGATFVAADLVEGVTFQATQYGVTHTYMPSKLQTFGSSGNQGTQSAIFMRFD